MKRAVAEAWTSDPQRRFTKTSKTSIGRLSRAPVIDVSVAKPPPFQRLGSSFHGQSQILCLYAQYVPSVAMASEHHFKSTLS